METLGSVVWHELLRSAMWLKLLRYVMWLELHRLMEALKYGPIVWIMFFMGLFCAGLHITWAKWRFRTLSEDPCLTERCDGNQELSVFLSVW